MLRNSRRDVLRFGAGALAGGLAAAWSPAWSPAGVRGDEKDDEVALSKGPKLKIRSVETFHLRHQLKRPFGASVSVPLPTIRETLLVKIQTDEGLVGWGETGPISGARGTIEDHLGPKLIGRNPLHYRQLWREMWGANFGNALAVGAVDTAINDLRGQALGIPMAELFGGRFRDTVPVYVSALNYVSTPEIEEEYPQVAKQMVDQGFKAIKMRLGRYSVARERRVVESVRDAVGPNIKLLADGNGAYTQASSLQMAHILHDLDFMYLEEPLPQVTPGYAGYEDLRRKMPLPLAGGEGLDSRASGKALLDRRCFDIIQPDLSLCGGLGEALFIAELAALSGVRCMPHCWGGDIVIAATAHLMSLVADPHWGHPTDTPMLELDKGENPWRDGLATQPLKVENGRLTVPREPGLGIKINEDVVQQYAVKE
jgi:D-galactarolactone cycloisomerase